MPFAVEIFFDENADKLVRDVTENCRTLKFTNFGFEEA